MSVMRNIRAFLGLGPEDGYDDGYDDGYLYDSTSDIDIDLEELAVEKDNSYEEETVGVDPSPSTSKGRSYYLSLIHI